MRQLQFFALSIATACGSCAATVASGPAWEPGSRRQMSDSGPRLVEARRLFALVREDLEFESVRLDLNGSPAGSRRIGRERVGAVLAQGGRDLRGELHVFREDFGTLNREGTGAGLAIAGRVRAADPNARVELIYPYRLKIGSVSFDRDRVGGRYLEVEAAAGVGFDYRGLQASVGLFYQALDGSLEDSSSGSPASGSLDASQFAGGADLEYRGHGRTFYMGVGVRFGRLEGLLLSIGAAF